MAKNDDALRDSFREEIIKYYAESIERICSNVRKSTGDDITTDPNEYLYDPLSPEDGEIRFSLKEGSSSDSAKKAAEPKKTAEEFHSWEKKNASYKSFSGLLDNYLESKKIPSGEFFERSHIDRKLLSKIKTDFTYHPTKLTAIRACVGLDLTLEQAVELLETAGYTLSSASSFDLAIRFCLIKSITDIEIINGILTELEEPLLL